MSISGPSFQTAVMSIVRDDVNGTELRRASSPEPLDLSFSSGSDNSVDTQAEVNQLAYVLTNPPIPEVDGQGAAGTPEMPPIHEVEVAGYLGITGALACMKLGIQYGLGSGQVGMIGISGLALGVAATRCIYKCGEHNV